jgi:hypothetical protein
LRTHRLPQGEKDAIADPVEREKCCKDKIAQLYANGKAVSITSVLHGPDASGVALIRGYVGRAISQAIRESQIQASAYASTWIGTGRLSRRGGFSQSQFVRTPHNAGLSGRFLLRVQTDSALAIITAQPLAFTGDGTLSKCFRLSLVERRAPCSSSGDVSPCYCRFRNVSTRNQRAEAKQLPHGADREILIQTAWQPETAMHIDEWLSSPGPHSSR